MNIPALLQIDTRGNSDLDVFPGILPRDGRNITFKEMTKAVRESYNFAPTFCWYVPNVIARILGRDYETGVFNLSDIDVHNGIEHDASFTSTHSVIFFNLCSADWLSD